MLHIRVGPSPKLPRPSISEVLHRAAPHFPGNLSMNRVLACSDTTQECFWMEQGAPVSISLQGRHGCCCCQQVTWGG